eukprot:COSAG01_NODE_16646_length_1218_cov_1.348525_2_plen_180_part_00
MICRCGPRLPNHIDAYTCRLSRLSPRIHACSYIYMHPCALHHGYGYNSTTRSRATASVRARSLFVLDDLKWWIALKVSPNRRPPLTWHRNHAWRRLRWATACVVSNACSFSRHRHPHHQHQRHPHNRHPHRHALGGMRRRSWPHASVDTPSAALSSQHLSESPSDTPVTLVPPNSTTAT